MPAICYVEKRFNTGTRHIIKLANEIIRDYVAQGFRLTLRQIYYQFIAMDLFPESWIDEEYNRKHNLDPRTKNTIKNYKRLGSILNDARLGGQMDWDALEDRTRHVASIGHWETPGEIIEGAAASFRVDKWLDQPYRPEVWIEKEALAGIVEGVCQRNDIPFLCCRGYTSQSEMWGSAMRLQQTVDGGQTPYILHFGDHDPSGIDMTRDIMDRMSVFGVEPEFHRLALNIAQVQQYKCPPNPAKETDSRFKGYKDKFGDESWELDALKPNVIADLIQDKIDDIRDPNAWNDRVAYENKCRAELAYARDNWTLIEKAMTKRRRKGK
jgi:hypothetical protein